MSQVKEEVVNMIRQLPDDAGIAEIMAELCFRQRVDSGLRELDEGKGLSHEQVRERPAKGLS